MASNASFASNTALEHGGAVDAGGGATFRSVGACVFRGNVAASGSGGAFFLDDATATFSTSDAFLENAAPRGGGGVVYYVHTRTSAPEYPAGAAALGNEAYYGNATASGAATLVVSHNATAPEESGRDLAAPLVATVLDAEGHVMALLDSSASDPTFQARVSVEPDWQRNATVSGVQKLEFRAGVATSTSFAVLAAPGTAIPFTATLTVGDDVLSDRFVLAMRACQPGETTEALWCDSCERGTYSVDPSVPCAPCPDDAICRGGASVVPVRGYWRSAYDSVNIRKCPRVEACASGVDLLDASFGAAGPDAQCVQNHRGPLCMLCERGYTLESGKHRCLRCTSNQTRKFYFFVAVLAGAARTRERLTFEGSPYLSRVLQVPRLGGRTRARTGGTEVLISPRG